MGRSSEIQIPLVKIMAFHRCERQVLPRFPPIFPHLIVPSPFYLSLYHPIYCSPPTSCSLNYNRDCPPAHGCVIGALTNQTTILKTCIKNQDYSPTCSDALKFIVHFFGDITQPLHCSMNQEGGNLIQVHFDHESANLHHVPSSPTPF